MRSFRYFLENIKSRFFLKKKNRCVGGSSVHPQILFSFMKSVCVCVLKKFSRKLKKEPHVCVNDRPTFVKIWKKRSVQEFSPAPYLATLVNCMVWTLYGLPIVHPNSILVVTINGSGVVIEIVYIILFLIYSPPKKRLKVFAWFVLDLIFMAALTVLTLTLAHTHKQRSAIVGTVCIIFNIMMYASPLAVMVCSPIPLIINSFAC